MASLSLIFRSENICEAAVQKEKMIENSFSLHQNLSISTNFSAYNIDRLAKVLAAVRKIIDEKA